MAVEMLSCDKDGSLNDFLARLIDGSERYYIEKTGKKINIRPRHHYKGMIGIRVQDVYKNNCKAKINVIIDMDELSVKFEEYHFNSITAEEFEKKYPDVNIKKLDVFPVNIYNFKFYEIDEALKFHMEHGSNMEKYFLLRGFFDKIYSLA